MLRFIGGLLILALYYQTANTQAPCTVDCIYNAYNQTYPQAGSLIGPPEPHRICQVFYTSANVTYIECYATYAFNDNSTGWSLGRSFVPETIIFGLPFCAIADATIVSATPPECAGELLYGFQGISAVTNQSDRINGIDAENNIIGLRVPALDLGYPEFSKGSVYWQRPAACASFNPTFQIQFGVGVLGDVVDWAPIRVTDSSSGETLDVAAIGIACGNTGGRLPTSAILNAQPSLVPICRGYIHCVDQVNVTICEQQMQNSTSASNLEVNSDVYQLRVDGLGPGLLVHTEIALFYADNNHTFLEYNVGYDDTYYFASRGDLPAAVAVCYYTQGCSLALTWNEVQLGYLPPCDCSEPDNNIICNATVDILLGPFNRSEIPNFNVLQPFVPVPFCAFAINPSNNGTFVVEDRQFALQSLASGGAGPLFYAWQLANLPPSGGVIFAPNNQQTVQAIVYAPMILTVVHTVWNLNSPAQTCNQTIEVIVGAPIAVVNPSSTTMFIGTTITLDGNGSYSPDMVVLTYNWTLLAAPYPYNGGFVTLPNNPATGFTCTVLGRYVVSLVVNNTVTVGSAMASILCVAQPPPPPPSVGPVAQPLPPAECTVTLPPVVTPPSESPPPQAPLAPVPLPPSYIPAPPTTTPLAPSAIPTESITGLMVVFAFVFLTCFGFAIYKGCGLVSGKGKGGGGGGNKDKRAAPAPESKPGNIVVRHDNQGRLVIDNNTDAQIKYHGV